MTKTTAAPVSSAFGFVGNPGARSGKRLEEALRLLGEKGADVEPALVEGPAVQEAVRALLAQGRMRIIVAGGDGTITAAIQAMVHKDAELAIIPMGTQNNFANTLGIPSDLAEACHLAAQGAAAPVDVGCVDGRYFGNAVTIGLSGRIARRTTPGFKRVLGELAYAMVGLRELISIRPFSCKLTSEGQTKEVRTHQLVIANGRRIGGAVAAPGANAHDGMLDISTLGNGSRRSLLAAWWAFRRRRHTRRADTVQMHVPDVRIETHPSQRVDIDGELAHRTPTTVWVERQALQVVVPKDRHGALPLSP